MRLTSKTGLLPISRKNDRIDTGGRPELEMPKMVVPAPFTLKPFAGIYNPFSHGCSILCNHPAGFDAKSVIKKAKLARSSEGKSLVDLDEFSRLRGQERADSDRQSFSLNDGRDNNVPEELFRKYTETDSRPITPTPTLASVVTKNLSRRCMTPDPTSFKPEREKTLLVLDLRRSHSQETFCWPKNQVADVNFESNLRQEALSRTISRLSTNDSFRSKKKKSDRKKLAPSSATRVSTLKRQISKDSESKGQIEHSPIGQSPSKNSVSQELQTPETHAISPEGSFSDPNIVKRRGKRAKKGKKTGKEGTKGEKEFQGIPDPGETQVSALENESKEGSSRRSSTEGNFQKNHLDGSATVKEPKPQPKEKNTSFLSPDILKRLQRQLDQNMVESELNAKRKIALEEALRLKATPKQTRLGEEMKNLQKEFQLVIKDSEKWLSIRRVFTRQSARFELPMDSRTLNDMTPLQYVAKYVFASPERLALYNHVFTLFKEDPEDDDDGKERVLLGRNMMQALGNVMGRMLTAEEAKDFQSLIKWEDKELIGFRVFAGISATCERVMSPHFCSKMLSQKEDPRPEIERADFETLDEKLCRLNPDRNLVRLLKSVRDL